MPRSARIDSAAAIRGHRTDWACVDEVTNYIPSVYNVTYPVINGSFNMNDGTDIIDAEWTDVGVEMRVDRWNTVWADIGQAYNKKVHCIEG